MNIVLGVTGGIAAYKAVSLVRLLVEAGHEVHVVPTASALRFIGAPTWEAISRHRVTASVHEDVAEVRHVALGQRADLVVVAPATANTLAKMASGLADDLLGTTLLAARAPVLVAPAMHTEMWQHAATQDNVAILRARGVSFIGPESGRLTGDDSGAGRMSEPDRIAERVEEMLGTGAATDTRTYAAVPENAGEHADEDEDEDEGGRGGAGAVEGVERPAEPAADAPAAGSDDASGAATRPRDLDGLRVLVSAGGTREPIDPVRFLGNRSSGRQGVAVAAAAAERGAKVVLLAANVEAAVLADAEAHAAVRVVRVGTAAELEAAAVAASPGADVVVMAAAVADYRASEVSDAKLRKEDEADGELTLHLVENPDILAGLVRDRRPSQLIVGFAAETASDEDELLERGRRKAARKGVDLLAVNAVGWSEGFESDENTLHIIDADGARVRSAAGSKRQAADGLLDAIVAERRALSVS